MFVQSSQIHKTHPLKSFSIKVDAKFIEQIENKIKQYVSYYNQTIDLLLKSMLLHQKVDLSKLESINKLFEENKNYFNLKLIQTKKGKKYTFGEFFSKDVSAANLWFKEIFRNNREEDNIWIIFQFFLGKQVLKNLSDINGEKLYNLLKEFKEKEKNEFIVSSLYGGIELANVANYLGFDSAWVNYSVYHLKNKSTYLNLEDVIFNLKWNVLKADSVILVDDNTYTGKTLSKLDSLFQNHHIPVKIKAVPRIGLVEEELTEFRKYKRIWNKLKSQVKNGDKVSVLLLLNRINKTLINREVPVSALKKQIALNADYLLPRKKYKSREINLLVARKVKHFRRKFNKEMRSL